MSINRFHCLNNSCTIPFATTQEVQQNIQAKHKTFDSSCLIMQKGYQESNYTVFGYQWIIENYYHFSAATATTVQLSVFSFLPICLAVYLLECLTKLSDYATNRLAQKLEPVDCWFLSFVALDSNINFYVGLYVCM